MKKNESSIQSLIDSSKTSGLSLEEYREQIGSENYWKEYRRIYAYTNFLYESDKRYSDTDNKPDLDKIKEKYKNGVTDDILREWLF